MTLIKLLVAAAILPSTYLALLLLAPKRPRRRQLGDLQSVLIPSYTSHARVLPTPTKHAFSYPLIYLGIDVDALEAGRLDLPMRFLTYGGNPLTKVLGLRSLNYLTAGEGSLRSKLEQLLLGQEMAMSQMSRAWLVTMPSMLGFETINPLTVWYVYDDSRQLSCVVLEVHNTFGEKHAYVLPSDSEHAVEPNEGYSHSWIFPRTFHVSPFNSRNGFYRLDTVDPFPRDASPADPVQMKVFLRLLTPDKAVKLTAVVGSHPSHPAIPLEPTRIPSILFALARWPAALFFATPRILYHAYILQYVKGLAMFPRPEPRTEGQYGVWNPPQNYRDGLGVSLGWQERAGSETWLQKLVAEWAEERSRQTGIGMRLVFRDERKDFSIGTSAKQVIDIETSDPVFFSQLVSSPTPAHFVTLAPELLTTISDPQLFTTLFSTTARAFDRIDTSLSSLRDDLFRWYISHSTVSVPPHLLIYPPGHFTSTLSRKTRLWLVWVLWLHSFSIKTEEWVMYSISARFVHGAEPWKLWERALKKLYAREPVDELEGWEDLGSTQYR